MKGIRSDLREDCILLLTADSMYNYPYSIFYKLYRVIVIIKHIRPMIKDSHRYKFEISKYLFINTLIYIFQMVIYVKMWNEVKS